METKGEKPQIWFVNTCGSRNIGGGETARTQWSNALAASGYEISWWCPDAAEYKRLDQQNLVPEGVKVRILKTSPMPLVHGFPSPNALAEFLRSFLSERPSRVIFNGYSHFQFPLVSGLLQLKQADKIVQVFHGDPSPPQTIKNPTRSQQVKSYLYPLRDTAARRIYSNHQITNVAVSRFVAQRIKELGITSSLKVCYPPGFNDPGCAPQIKIRTEGSPLEILTVSRLAPEKGLPLLARIATASKEQNLPIHFSLVGAAPNQRYADQVQEMMAGKVSLLGPRIGRELCDAYHWADLKIMPSGSEGFGLVIAESIRHGTPVIARGIPVVREILSDNHPFPGRLVSVEEERATYETVEFLKAALTNRNLLPELSAAAIKAGSRFNPEALSRNFVSMITSN